MIITIGGKAGSGKSSVAKQLAKKLGYKFYSAGDVRRKYALSKGMSLAELNRQAEKNPFSDKMVDEYLKKMAESEDDFVVDGRMGFYFIPKSIKILLEADEKARAERLIGRGKSEENPEDLKEALKLVRQRDASDVVRYKKLYNINPYEEKHYDFVLDTTNNTVEESADEIYSFVKDRAK
jgi:cytidylate kinase